MVGDEGLGALARDQLARARKDPRLERNQTAAVADFWDAIEEAERVRTLGILGLHELLHTLDRHERELGVRHTDPGLDANARRTLQAMWERTESARIEIEHDHPHLNAQAVLSYVSALDAMVEDMLRTWRGLTVKPFVDELLARAGEQVPDAARALAPETREAVEEVATEQVARRALGRAERLRDCGPERYERVLTTLGLQAPDDRPLPDGLVDALTEVNALRDVLMHRAGRIDLRAMREAPTLTYKRGQLVRLTSADYRRYSSAIRCYAQEVWFRGIRSWPEVTDEEDGPDLDRWDQYYMLGA